MSELIYVVSRASVPERSEMWRHYRHAGVPIISSWIDEAAKGYPIEFAEFWNRIMGEIERSTRVVLYAETGDFPLMAALVEIGVALGLGKPVTVCLPGVWLEGRGSHPIGSWIAHRLVVRDDDIVSALAWSVKEE